MTAAKADRLDPMESELKLELDLATYNGLMALRGPGREPAEQINTFYDSAAGDLKRLQLALRLRREGPRAWLTVKGAPVREDVGYFVRPENEAEITAEEAARLAGGFRLSDCPREPVRALLLRSGDLAVVPFCAFVNYRTRVQVHAWAFDLDRTLIGGLALYELEMEGAGEGRDLQDWLRSQGYSFRPATRTKLAIAMGLAPR